MNIYTQTRNYFVTSMQAYHRIERKEYLIVHWSQVKVHIDGWWAHQYLVKNESSILADLPTVLRCLQSVWSMMNPQLDILSRPIWSSSNYDWINVCLCSYENRNDAFILINCANVKRRSKSISRTAKNHSAHKFFFSHSRFNESFILLWSKSRNRESCVWNVLVSRRKAQVIRRQCRNAKVNDFSILVLTRISKSRHQSMKVRNIHKLDVYRLLKKFRTYIIWMVFLQHWQQRSVTAIQKIFRSMPCARHCCELFLQFWIWAVYVTDTILRTHNSFTYCFILREQCSRITQQI